MVSSYGIEDFRQRLAGLSLSEVAPPQIKDTFVRSSSTKPFVGSVTDSYFNLTAAGPYLWGNFLSYHIEGTFRGDASHTDVNFKLERDMSAYVVLRAASFGFYVLIQWKAYDYFSLVDFLKIQVLISCILIPILYDIYQKNILLKTFFKEMKISPPTTGIQ